MTATRLTSPYDPARVARARAVWGLTNDWARRLYDGMLNEPVPSGPFAPGTSTANRLQLFLDYAQLAAGTAQLGVSLVTTLGSPGDRMSPLPRALADAAQGVSIAADGIYRGAGYLQALLDAGSVPAAHNTLETTREWAREMQLNIGKAQQQLARIVGRRAG